MVWAWRYSGFTDWLGRRENEGIEKQKRRLYFTGCRGRCSCGRRLLSGDITAEQAGLDPVHGDEETVAV